MALARRLSGRVREGEIQRSESTGMNKGKNDRSSNETRRQLRPAMGPPGEAGRPAGILPVLIALAAFAALALYFAAGLPTPAQAQTPASVALDFPESNYIALEGETISVLLTPSAVTDADVTGKVIITLGSTLDSSRPTDFAGVEVPFTLASGDPHAIIEITPLVDGISQPDYFVHLHVTDLATQSQTFQPTAGRVGLLSVKDAGALLWEATLTVDSHNPSGDEYFTGCSNFQSPGMDACSSSSVLTEDTFAYEGTDYTITEIYFHTLGQGQLDDGIIVRFDQLPPAGFRAGYTLRLGDNLLKTADARWVPAWKTAIWEPNRWFLPADDAVVSVSLHETPLASEGWHTLLYPQQLEDPGNTANPLYGCDNASATTTARCSNSPRTMAKDDFTMDGRTWTVQKFTHENTPNLNAPDRELEIHLDGPHNGGVGAHTLRVLMATTTLKLDPAGSITHSYPSGSGTDTRTITGTATSTPASTTVSWSGVHFPLYATSTPTTLHFSTVPMPVEVPALTAGGKRLEATWGAPALDGGLDVESYQVQYKNSDAADQAATTPGDPSTGWVDVEYTAPTPVWEATLSPKDLSVGFGCNQRGTGAQFCSVALDDNDFQLPNGATSTVTRIFTGDYARPGDGIIEWLPGETGDFDIVYTGTVSGQDLADYVLYVGDLSFPVSEAVINTTSNGRQISWPRHRLFLRADHASPQVELKLVQRPQRSVEIADLEGGVSVDVRARPVNGNGPGQWSAAASATPLTPGITVSHDTLNLNEGTTADFTVVLDTQPTADVQIEPESSDENAATSTPRSVTFTPDNWNVPQTFTMNAVQDADFLIEYVAINLAVASDDPDYAALHNAKTVTVVVTDDEMAFIISADTLDISEGDTATYTIALGAEPTASVQVTPATSDDGAATVLPASLTFTTTNWSEAQAVTVTAVQDDDQDSETVTISHTVTTDDTAYSTVAAPAAVTVNVIEALPGPPAGLTLTPGDASLQAQWAVPKHTGQSAISRYDLEHRELGAADQASTNPADGWVGNPIQRSAVPEETVWSATLTAGSTGGSVRGCKDGFATDCTAALTDNDFTLDGVTYRVNSIQTDNNGAYLDFSARPVMPPDIALYDLHVDGSVFSFSDSDDQSSLFSQFNSPGITFTDAQTVQVKLVKRPTVTASITGLTNLTRYEARVRAVNDQGAGGYSDPVAETPLPSGTYWAAKLTAKNVDDYVMGCRDTHTSPDAKCATAATLEQQDFPYEGAYYRVTEILAATTTLKVSLDTAIPSAFDLLSFQVGADDRYPFTAAAKSNSDKTATWTVTQRAWDQGDQVQLAISASVPGRPDVPTLTPGNRQLTAAWTAPTAPPTAPITGYDVWYKKRSAATSTTPTGNPDTGYVDAGHRGTDTAMTITGLENLERYDVIVRARNRHGAGSFSYERHDTPLPPNIFWAAKLPVQDLIQGNLGCDNINAAILAQRCDGETLDDRFFDYSGATYEIDQVINDGGLTVTFDRAIPSAFDSLAFQVAGSDPLPFVSAVKSFEDKTATWAGYAETWTAGDTLQLTIGISGVPYGLKLESTKTSLTVTWTAPPGEAGAALDGYDVWYKKSSAPDTDAAGSDPAAGWVDALHTGTAATATITGLDSYVKYDVRVRAVDTDADPAADGIGDWSSAATGRPSPPGSETLWESTLTVGAVGAKEFGVGCGRPQTLTNAMGDPRRLSARDDCTAAELSDTHFTFRDTEYGVAYVNLRPHDGMYQQPGNLRVAFGRENDEPKRVDGLGLLTLLVGDEPFLLREGSGDGCHYCGGGVMENSQGTHVQADRDGDFWASETASAEGKTSSDGNGVDWNYGQVITWGGSGLGWPAGSRVNLALLYNPRMVWLGWEDVVRTPRWRVPQYFRERPSRGLIDTNHLLNGKPVQEERDGLDQTRVPVWLAEPAGPGGVTVTVSVDSSSTADGRGVDYQLLTPQVRIPEGERRGSVLLRVIDDSHEDSGETIVLKAETEGHIFPYPYTIIILNHDDELPEGAVELPPAEDPLPPEMLPIPGKSANANLRTLTLLHGWKGALEPAFSPDRTEYRLHLTDPRFEGLNRRVFLTVHPQDGEATVTVGGRSIQQGVGYVTARHFNDPVTIPVVVTAADGVTTRTYTLVARIPPPPAGTYSLNAAAAAAEGQNALLTITLSEAAPADGVEFSVSAAYFGSADSGDVGSIASPVTVPEGSDTLQVAVPTASDAVDEDDESFTVTVAAVTPGWETADDGQDTATVTVTDDDTAGVTVTPTTLNVAEDGSVTYTVVLDSRPTAEVTITASSGGDGAASVTPASLTFAPSEWDMPRTFTVTGVDDADSNDESVAITHEASSADAKYQFIPMASVAVAVADDDAQRQQQEPAPVELPGPVVNLQLSATGDSVTVTWQAPETGGAPANYIVHLRPEQGGPGSGKTKTPNAGKTTATFRNLKDGATYKVWARAQNEAGKGQRVHADVTLPELPGPVVNLQLSATADSLTVTWEAPQTGSAPEGYIVRLEPQGDGKGVTRRPGADKTTVTFRDLAAGAAYEVWARAQNQHGKGQRVHASVTLTEAAEEVEPQEQAPPKTYSVGAAASAAEGQDALLTLTLSEAAPADGVEFSVSLGYDGSADSGDLGTVASPVTVAQGNDTLTIAVPTVDDAVDEDDETFTVTVAAVTQGWDPAGAGQDAATVTVTDDDTAGVTITPTSLSIAEDGSASYDVVLDSQPTGDVTVTASSGDAGAASFAPASLTFTPSGWNVPQTFTVSGVGDADSNDESVAIIHEASSDDTKYQLIPVASVSVTVADDDVQQQQQVTPKTFSLSSAASAAEGGDAALTLTLSEAAPASGVEFNVSAGYSGSADGADVGSIASPVTVPGGSDTLTIAVPTVDDAVDEDDETFTVTVAAVTAGWDKAGAGQDTATVTIVDDDTAGVTVTPTSLSIAEDGSVTYAVVLDSRPTADVTVTASGDDDGAASVAPASLTFAPSGWNVPLTFTVSGVGDDDRDDESVGVSHRATSNDVKYEGVAVAAVAVAVADTTPPPAPESACPEAAEPPEPGQWEPYNVCVTPGDGTLTVTWTVASRDGFEDHQIKHSLRWSQEPGVWANPPAPEGGREDGIPLEGGVYSYTITGLENGVATGVFVRSFTGGSYSERSPHSSKWVRTKGDHTTPRAE